MLQAYMIAASGPDFPEQREWCVREGWDIISSRKEKIKSLEMFSHSISAISELELENPNSEYWDGILEIIGQVPTDQYIDAESL